MSSWLSFSPAPRVVFVAPASGSLARRRGRDALRNMRAVCWVRLELEVSILGGLGGGGGGGGTSTLLVPLFTFAVTCSVTRSPRPVPAPGVLSVSLARSRESEALRNIRAGLRMGGEVSIRGGLGGGAGVLVVLVLVTLVVVVEEVVVRECRWYGWEEARVWEGAATDGVWDCE